MALDPAVDGDRTGGLATRCPACDAGLRPDAPWCTQCWLDLRAPEPAPPAPPRDDDPLDAAPPAAPAGTWPCPCGASNDLVLDACPVCGGRLFDALRGAAEPALALPVLGDVARLSKAQLGAAAGVALAVLLVVLLAVLALAGALLT